MTRHLAAVPSAAPRVRVRAGQWQRYPRANRPSGTNQPGNGIGRLLELQSLVLAALFHSVTHARRHVLVEHLKGEGLQARVVAETWVLILRICFVVVRHLLDLDGRKPFGRDGPTGRPPDSRAPDCGNRARTALVY